MYNKIRNYIINKYYTLLKKVMYKKNFYNDTKFENSFYAKYLKHKENNFFNYFEQL